MRRPGGRLPRRTACNLCLLMTLVVAVFLVFNVLTKQRPTVHTSKNLHTSPGGVQSDALPLAWRQSQKVEEATSFKNSVYNAANKRKLTATASVSSAEPKVISWQASRTLRILSTTSDMFQHCPVKTCEVSPSSKSLPKAQAVVFDDGKMNKQTPPQLTDNRVLVYYDMRTPSEVYFKAKGDLFSPYWKSAINWVWSYRLGSDIFEPFAYLQRSPVTVYIKKAAADAIRKKKKLAAWVNPKVNRKEDSLEDIDKNFHKSRSQTAVEDYVRELKKTISLDTTDMISLQAEMKEHVPGKDFSLSKYYFIFAFEWVSCQDYVSDLFFYAFDPRVTAIPVVRGAVNYTRYFPQDTFINADDFESPKALAKYLERLASNTRLYHQMLVAKSQHVREEGVSHAWCQLCDLLHRLPQDKSLLQRYKDIHAWREDHSRCVVTNSSEAEQPDLSSAFME